jgi:hypothetical protein
MCQRNRVLLFITIIISFCTVSYSFAKQIVTTENVAENSRQRGTDKTLSDTALADNQHVSTEQLNLKQQLEQGLDEFRQTLLKHQKSIALQDRRLANQSKIIAVQKSVLEKQEQELKNLRNQILSQDQLKTQRAAGIQYSKDTDSTTINEAKRNHPWSGQPASEEQYQVADNTNPSETTSDTGEVKKSLTEERPEVTAIPEIGGVLTPRGKLMLEPGIQASHSSFNQFTFLGTEIVNTFLVGLIQAEDTDRNLISSQLTARYGITSHLEAEFKIPYVYRTDKVSGTIPQIPDPETGVAATLDRDFDGHGLGDIELALHYQINNGLNGWPYFIGNLRWKSDTGEGPFDVERNALGQENESPTGSGFHSLEPSLTILYPADPAVFFANIGYLINFEKDLDKTFIQSIEASGDVEAQTFGNVDPGDSVRISFGMGYSLNERSSLTLGYKHDFIDATKFEINGANISTNDLDVGSLLLGWGFAFTPDINVNLNLELGITQDAPDVLVTLRVPFTAYEFYD